MAVCRSSGFSQENTEVLMVQKLTLKVQQTAVSTAPVLQELPQQLKNSLYKGGGWTGIDPMVINITIPKPPHC